MGVAETVRDSEVLLEQMTEKPEAVLEALDPEDGVRVMSNLHVLTSEAAKVRSEADLLYVANRLRRLVEGMPALAALFLLSDPHATEARKRSKRRKITKAYYEAAQQESRHAQERAAQIRNHVVECRQNLGRALQEIAKQSRDNDR
jgi:hypothetical protein